MQRLRTWIANIPNIPTILAFRLIRRAIRKDTAYAEGWQSNIAMALYDESRSARSVSSPYAASVLRRMERGDFDGILRVPRSEAVDGLRDQIAEQQALSHEFCNRATARFMQICFGVNTRPELM